MKRVFLSKDLKRYIRNFESIDLAADRLDVDASTLYALLGNERSPSNDFIAKVQTNVGWPFEKAFDIFELKEDK